jgi:DHA2 family multidrug resistance protein
VIPQFLSTIAGYNSLQSGEVVLLSGVPMILLMPFMPLMMRHIPIRRAVGFGMFLLALSAWLETDLTPLSSGVSFVASQLLRGLGTVCAMMFLNQAAIRSVPPSQAGDAAGLYNAARNLGGSLALASIAVIQEQRMWLHSRRIEDSLDANSVLVQDYVASQAHALGSTDLAIGSIGNIIQIQALTMTYADLFWMLAIGICAISPLIFLLRPLPGNAPPVQAH